LDVFEKRKEIRARVQAFQKGKVLMILRTMKRSTVGEKNWGFV